MSIPTLAEHLAGNGARAPRGAPTRVHRLGDEAPAPAQLPKASQVHRIARPEDHEPPAEPTRAAITPFVAGDAKGDLTIPRGEIAMPKGQYPRKPRAAKETIPGAPEQATSRAPRKKREPKAKPGRLRKSDHQPVGAASFVIDDRGGMEIRDGQQSVRLERADVGRLTLFLERTKGIRA
jgi:hypothetical protein